MLDGRNGVVLALILFGASVFGSRRSLPEGFQIDHSVRRSGQRVMGFFVLNLGTFGALKTGQKRLRFECWGVESMSRTFGTGIPKANGFVCPRTCREKQGRVHR